MMIAPLFLFASTSAFGSGLDADGAGLPVAEGAGVGLVSGAPGTEPGTIDLGLRAAYAASPLVRTAGDGVDRLVGWSAGARLQAAYAPLTPLAFTVDAPIRLAAGSTVDGTGAALGDLRLGGWWRPTFHGVLRTGVGLGVRIPTGQSEAFAGAARVIPELQGSLAWSGPLLLSTRVGLATEGPVVATEARGGLRAAVAARAGLERGALDGGLSVRTRFWTDRAVWERRGTAAELGLDVGVAATERLRLQGLLTRALGAGAGTAVWGGSVGLVGSLGTAAPPPPPPVGEVQTVQLVDPAGTPVAGALLVFPDREELRADTAGRASWPAERGQPLARASGLASTPIEPGSGPAVEMEWAPLPLSLRVATATGVSAEPAVSLALGVTPRPIASSGGGVWTASLVPGEWTVDVSADGYGSQSRVVTVLPRRTRPVELEVVLLEREGEARLELDVRDPQGLAIGGAEVRLDGIPVGTAGEGRVGIGGLAEGSVTVAVESRFFAERDVAVDLTEEGGAAEVDLFYSPGTVRIAARGPDGPVPDGLVYIDGPRSLPPVELDATGEKLVQLGEGLWDLALSSPAYGLQERRVLVESGGPVPLEALFVLSPETSGSADLVVRTFDVDGAPVGGVSLVLDGVELGVTGTGGELVARGLMDGPALLSGRAEGMEDVELPLTLRSGDQMAALPMRWKDGSLRVAARAGERPVDAQVDFAGPATYPGGRLGDPGRRLFLEVPDGEWELLASHESGMEVAWATVGATQGRLTDVGIVLPDEVGNGVLDLAVRDPSGGLLSDVEVRLDGQSIVRTASGGRVRIKGLVPGVRELELVHPWFSPWRGPVTIGRDTTVEQELVWRPGLLDVMVTDGGSPVADALLYLVGPEEREPVEVGGDGEAIVSVTPGTWEILVSSPAAGLATEIVEVDDRTGPPQQVRVELATEGLAVQVVDRRGRPAVGATVRRDGEVAGTTNAAGIVVMPLVDGEGAVVTVEHPAIVPVDPITLGAGERDRRIEVRWAPRPVALRARHEGDFVAVRITANGPGRIPPVAIDGEGTVELPPGRWELLASAGDDLGTVRQFVDVPYDDVVPSVSFDLSAAQVRQTATGLELIDVRFAPGADVAGAAFQPVLEEIAATIVADPRIARVEVQGHTDPTGGPEVNFGLSRRRSSSIVQALVELGVPQNLLTARGYGSSRPIADNATESGRARNRRVDFRIQTTGPSDRDSDHQQE